MARKIKHLIIISMCAILLVGFVKYQNFWVPVNNDTPAAEICKNEYRSSRLSAAMVYANSTGVDIITWSYIFGLKLECKRQVGDIFYYVFQSEKAPFYVFVNSQNKIMNAFYEATYFDLGTSGFSDWVSALNGHGDGIRYYFTLQDSEETLIHLHRDGSYRIMQGAVLLSDGVVVLEVSEAYTDHASISWKIYTYEDWANTFTHTPYVLLEVDR